jgi:hypothetical protein
VDATTASEEESDTPDGQRSLAEYDRETDHEESDTSDGQRSLTGYD